MQRHFWKNVLLIIRTQAENERSIDEAYAGHICAVYKIETKDNPLEAVTLEAPGDFYCSRGYFLFPSLDMIQTKIMITVNATKMPSIPFHMISKACIIVTRFIFKFSFLFYKN